MKYLRSLLLVSLVAGSGAAFGQGHFSPDGRDSVYVPRLLVRPVWPGNALVWAIPGSGKRQLELGRQAPLGPRPAHLERALLMAKASVRIMRPDHMPCVVPNLVVVEAMPVLREGGKDNMPQVKGEGK